MLVHHDSGKIWLVPALALALACGGGEVSGPPPPPPPPPAGTFTSLTLTAPTTTLFSVAPGNSVSLAATPRDQNGAGLSGLGTPTFTSGATGVATVTAAGVVTAVAAGAVQITASLTAQGVTRTGSVSLNVVVAPQTASVTNQLTTFVPGIVDIRAGGSVSWTFGPVAHDVTFAQAGAPANIAAFADGTQSRTFSSNGNFDYQCTIHAGMTGTVRVH